MKKLNKKGSHVSFVLSFVIFVVSLIFIYMIVSAAIPKKETKDNSLSFLERNVLKKISSEVWVIRAHNLSSGTGCVSFSEPVTITNGSIIALNDSGLIDSSLSGNNIFVKNSAGAVKIYYSDSLNNPNQFNLTGCSQGIPDSVKKEKKFLENKIVDLFSSFLTNYSSLKKELEVPSGMDFNLFFEYGNGSMIGKPQRDLGVEIYSKNMEIYYLSKNASDEKGKLRVLIW